MCSSATSGARSATLDSPAIFFSSGSSGLTPFGVDRRSRRGTTRSSRRSSSSRDRGRRPRSRGSVCSVSLLRSWSSSKRPQPARSDGTGFFAIQPPQAKLIEVGARVGGLIERVELQAGRGVGRPEGLHYIFGSSGRRARPAIVVRTFRSAVVCAMVRTVASGNATKQAAANTRVFITTPPRTTNRSALSPSPLRLRPAFARPS